jgi:hypothetical protein
MDKQMVVVLLVVTEVVVISKHNIQELDFVPVLLQDFPPR